MPGAFTVNSTLPSALKRVEGMVREIGEKRAALALARTIGNRKGRGVLSQVKEPSGKLLAKTIRLSKAKIKKEMRPNLAPRSPKSINDVIGSSDYIKRPLNATGFNKTQVYGGKNKTNRRRKKTGMSVKFWHREKASPVPGGFVTGKGRTINKQVWVKPKGVKVKSSKGGLMPWQRGYKSIFAPMVSRTARARKDPLVTQHQKLVDKLLPVAINDELERAAGKWTGKGAKVSGL